MHIPDKGLLVAALLFASAPPCRADPAVAGPKEEGLYVAPQAARQDRTAVLVDVRTPGDFERAHAPGAVNVPLFAVKTKAYLEKGTLVLIGPPFPSKALERACLSLRTRQRWRASILEGGLLRWKQQGFPLEGTDPSLQTLSRARPADEAAERIGRPWLLLDADNGGKEFGARPAPFGKGKDAFLSAVGAALAQAEGTTAIVNERGDYGAIEPLVQSRFPAAPILYMEGGWQAMRAFKAQAEALLHPGRDQSCSGEGCNSAARGCSTCR